MKTYRRLLPSMSQTEKEALEAGTVWWDGELFTGAPRWEKLLAAKPAAADRRGAGLPRRALRGSCARCSMTGTSRTGAPTCRPRCGSSSRPQGFFAMIIPKHYGGLEFSAYAHSCVLAKLASRSTTCSSTVAVPNSLGPGGAAQPLRHRGAEELLPAAPGARRGNALLRPHRAARRLGCRLHSRHRRRVPRHLAGPGSPRAEAQLLQALHHAGARWRRSSAWPSACSIPTTCWASAPTLASPAR